ncbi:membrane hypothetical protein [Magnetospirillum sp. LM-5]|uniref:DotA/TraY family protein n=1 Tax=Magnetospirillum sp. LM-5 TaxID=2681466 RepID=UPI001382BFB6|nr:DotA/TraY family protein [Magnetospirillum sp. LM-5]CAA7623685.1 membrane hypothetical protein [Magnetospirillum sp. LM-5]
MSVPPRLVRRAKAPFLGAAIYLGILLPIMSFTIWITAVIGWLVLTVEGVLGGVFWALAHLRPEGEGMSGEAGQGGWLILLNILTRPTLMIGGLFGGVAIFTVGAGLLLELWEYGTSVALASYTMGPVTQLVLIIVLASTLATMAQRSFRFITWLPDTVVRWMGGRSESLFELNDDDLAHRTVLAGVGHAGNTGQRTAMGSANMARSAAADRAQKAAGDVANKQKASQHREMIEALSNAGNNSPRSTGPTDNKGTSTRDLSADQTPASRGQTDQGGDAGEDQTLPKTSGPEQASSQAPDPGEGPA